MDSHAQCEMYIDYSRTIAGTGTIVLSKWPIVCTRTFDYSFNGMLHQLWHMDSWAQGSLGMVKVQTEAGITINAYVTHLIAQPDTQT